MIFMKGIGSGSKVEILAVPPVPFVPAVVIATDAEGEI
jgi:hypothetical protein